MNPERLLEILPWVVLVLPLAGFTSLCLLGDRIRRDKEDTGAGILACSTVFLAFLLAVTCAVSFHRIQGDHAQEMALHDQKLKSLGVTAESRKEVQEAFAGPVYVNPHLTVPSGFARGPLGVPMLASDASEPMDWIRVGDFRVPLSLLIDPMSLVMMLVVTGVGFLIHLYSLGYMAHDEERVRYFSYLNLFTFFMLLLVMGGSLPLMFVGWEGVGLCSYLLIGFWYRK